MAQHRHTRMSDGLDNPFGHFFLRLVEMRMHAADDIIKTRQRLFVIVETAIRENVALDALEEPDSLEAGVQRVDLSLLLANALGAKAVGDAQGLGMIGETEVFEPDLFGGLGHFLQRRLAVAPVGMAM